MTARGIALPNPALARVVADLCGRVGHLGVGDTDWRFDSRDGLLKLVDFNPRIGAGFQLFRSTSGLDIARALHLGMSPRAVSVGEQIDGRELVVEHLDAAAALMRLLRGGRGLP